MKRPGKAAKIWRRVFKLSMLGVYELLHDAMSRIVEGGLTVEVHAGTCSVQDLPTAAVGLPRARRCCCCRPRPPKGGGKGRQRGKGEQPHPHHNQPSHRPAEGNPHNTSGPLQDQHARSGRHRAAKERKQMSAGTGINTCPAGKRQVADPALAEELPHTPSGSHPQAPRRTNAATMQCLGAPMC